MMLPSKKKRLFLLCSSFLRFVKSGSAVKESKKIERIIIAPTGKLGDVVCCTPVFAAIRREMPTVQLCVFGDIKFLHAILDHSGLVDEYIDDSVQEDIDDKLKEYGAQVAIVTGPSFELAARLYISGIPLVIIPTVVGGFSPAETRPYGVLKKFVKTFSYNIESYAPRERLRALEPLGIISENTEKRLGFSAHAEKKIEKLFLEGNLFFGKDLIVAISPTAGNKIKEWPEDRFAEVADHLIVQYNAKIIILGGPNDSGKIRAVSEKIESDAKVLEVSELNIDELKALISKINLFISVDTGPIYIAEAFGIPTVNIVGPVDERVQPPRGEIHRTVIPPGRRQPQLSVLNARMYDEMEAERQVISTTAKAVMNEIDSLLDLIMRRS